MSDERTEKALDLATVLLTDDHLMAEALEAHGKGHLWFYLPGGGDLIALDVHLEEVAYEAAAVRSACRFAGLSDLADICEKIDLRICKTCVIGKTDAAACLADIKTLTTAGREALDAPEWRWQNTLHKPSLT